MINANGVITHKFFDNNLAVRVGPEQLLRAANGENIAAVQTTSANSNDSTFAVSFAGESLVPTVQRDLIVRFNVPDGRHVYADPAPAGSVAVTVQLDANDHLVQRPLVRPKPSPHTLGSSGERFNVHTGHFELRLPITVNVANIRKVPEVTITGEVLWQTCDDDVCDLPQREQFSLTLPIEQPPAPALGGPRRRVGTQCHAALSANDAATQGQRLSLNWQNATDAPVGKWTQTARSCPA